jgi:hypothetical protein
MVNVDNRGTGPRDPRGSNSSLYFIVGALVVAVLIIGWFLYGGNAADPVAGTGAATEAPAGGDTNVIVEDAADAPAAGGTTTTTPAAPAAEAPAEPAAPAADAPAADAPAAPADPAAPAAPAAPAQ